MISIEFVKKRSDKIRDMQVSLAAAPGWVWKDKTAQQWKDDCTLVDQLIPAESAAWTQWRNAAELWQSELDRIQRITRDVAREGSYRFRNEPVKQILFDGLHTDADSRGDIYADGLAARDAWKAAEPAWELLSEDTLAEFSAWLASSVVRQAAHSADETAWRLAANAIRCKARTLDAECVAWYADATRKFPAGTVEGDTIRQTVPTKTRAERPVGQAVISNAAAAGGEIQFDCTAANATRFTYLQRAPGAPAFVVIVADTPEKSLTLPGQPAGLHRFKAIGKNSRGEGPASAVVEVTVTATAVA